MKARVVVVLMLVVGLMCTSAHSFPPKRTDKGYVDAVTKGAGIWIQLSVIDDGGAPVADADVRATLSFHDGFRHVQGRTDSLGNVSVNGLALIWRWGDWAKPTVREGAKICKSISKGRQHGARSAAAPTTRRT